MISAQAVDALAKQGRISDKAAYLAKEGLVPILKRPSIGRNSQPIRVYQKEDGNWSFTFDEKIAGIAASSALVPVSCLENDRVFEPKKDTVTAFLVALGLTPAEAEIVIGANS
jgi:hypothetical protein